MKEMTKQDFLEYAKNTNNQDAYNLLLLAGADGVEMSYKEYETLLEYFERN